MYKLSVFDLEEEEPRMMLFYESKLELRLAYQLISKGWKIKKRFEIGYKEDHERVWVNLALREVVA